MWRKIKSNQVPVEIVKTKFDQGSKKYSCISAELQ